jgi:UDP-glucose 4-epimerase
VKVLVTGGSGFIGSHVVDRLRAHGHEPRIFDARPSPWHPPGEVPFSQGSITDTDALEDAMVGCEAVIHLAAVADVNHVHADPGTAETVNTRGTLAVLEAARRTGASRVVYGSTIWVYSDCCETKVDEESLLATPSHFYTSTKLAGELYLKAYAELYGIPYTVLRFGIPYGPRARPAAVVPAFVEKALSGQPLTIAGDGSQGRRFVYVEDLAEGVARSLAPVAKNRIYNLAGQETVTIKEIAEAVRDAVGEVEITYTPARAGDFGGKEVASARAEAELDWRADTPFAEGVARYVAWRRSLSAVDPGPPAPKKAARPRNVLILTADIGEGHDLPARALAAEIVGEDPSVEVTVKDGLTVMGPMMTRVVRDGSWAVFRHAPWFFDLQYALFARFAPTRRLARLALMAVGGRRIRRAVRESGADAVISTYPGVTEVLGELRRHGKLDVPCYSAITDLAGLRFWAHPGIDLHFVTHPESVEEVESIAGPGRTRWARPPTSPGFLAPRDRAAARAALDLPAEGTIIVISGGGWGMGDLTGAVSAALAIPGATVLALAGRNEEARETLDAAFGTEPRVRVMGFTDRMSDLLAAADALVHGTAGLTVLEAMIRGCPVISYGLARGHIRLNNEAYRRFGLAAIAENPAELTEKLRTAIASRPEPDGSFARRPSSASFVLDGPPARPVELAGRRLTPARSVAVAAASLILLAAATDVPYTMLQGPLHARPVSSVRTDTRQVGLLVDAPAGSAPALARTLSAGGAHASFVVSKTPAAGQLATLRSLGDEALPQLRGGALTRWVRTRSDLARRASRLGLGNRHFAYIVPRDGFTLGQYMLGRTLGAHAVRPAVEVTNGVRPGQLRAGVVLEIRTGTAGGPEVRRVLAALRTSGFEGVAVGPLVGASR